MTKKHDPVLSNAVCILVALAVIVMIGGIAVLRPTSEKYGQRVIFDRTTGHLEFIK